MPAKIPSITIHPLHQNPISKYYYSWHHNPKLMCTSHQNSDLDMNAKEPDNNIKVGGEKFSSPIVPEEVDRLSVTEEATEWEEVIGSIDEKLELIRARISEKLNDIQKTGRSRAEGRRRVAEKVGAASASHIELERELEEACEVEDLERAEMVSEKLAAAEAAKERLLSALRDAEAGCDAVEARMLEVLESQIAAEEEDVSLLEQFAKGNAGSDVSLSNYSGMVLLTANVTSKCEMV
ncbi:hypothetical protein QJS04_geneDACA021883 [Acorus gramineus]|uniref:Uncharacterized protein n=1 Tax=Acorus gramineus TaxID=55184 RepID=A0AAV9AIP1_ACOGR|nr:hypothetical protein QJS04_geneDACA021883 [Acorus gramineus]